MPRQIIQLQSFIQSTIIMLHALFPVLVHMQPIITIIVAQSTSVPRLIFDIRYLIWKALCNPCNLFGQYVDVDS